jgi:alpha-glucosidase
MMNTRRFCPLIVTCALCLCVEHRAFAADAVVVTAPESNLRVEISIRATPAAPAQLVYEMTSGDHPVVLPSALGVRLADGTKLGSDCELVQVATQKVDEGFEQFPGKRRLVANRSNEATLTLRERGEPRRRWQLIVRAYDDGVALRYRFPYQASWPELDLAAEDTEFNFPAAAVVTALPLAGFTTSHENLYERRPLAEIPQDWLIGPPLLVELPGTGWAAVLEANLKDYAGMYLARAGDKSATLVTRLAPRTDEPKLAVRALLPHVSPWRVILFAPQAKQLIESDLVLKLNLPSEIPDTSWIRPGKTTFPWWNDFYEENVPFKMGLNTATAKHYIDFCAEHGIAYHSLDGINDVAWYGGPIAPYAGADITQAVDGLDLPAVIAYAKEKGVRLRLWMHWEAARKHMERAFPLYHQWGIEGVMIDFMDRDDQEMVNFQRELLQLAADNQLTVTFHGVASPTGLERTYPNLLNSEAVMNFEYDKWNEGGVPPEHDVTVPLTRMLAGPMDYHQGTFRGVPLAEFKPRVANPLVIGTPCRMLATYVVFQNHLPMMADYPSAYRGHPLTKVVAEIPATWDETRAVEAQVGQSVAIARRSGANWWIGAMTDRKQRELKLPLEFLGVGKFRAKIYQDDLAAPQRFARRSQDVTASDVLTLPLAASGGALVKLMPYPANPGAPHWKLAWSDDFDTLDESKWRRFEGYEPTNDSQHAYLPEQVSVRGGKLVIRSENKPAGNLPYRSGQVFSQRAQRLGRWEIRAKLPGTAGMWPAIWLLPDGPWPSEGEIDIMENRGNQPSLTSSAFHWGTQSPYTHDYHAIEQRSTVGGKLVSYPDGFHTYAVEWLGDQLRFFVDDIHYATFYSDECGDFLPRLMAPMRLVINTAIGGHFLPPPDDTTVWPQEFLIDWVRVYEPADGAGERKFTNGDFESGGGTLAGWHVFGNRIEGIPNILVKPETARDGSSSLKMSGQSS